MKDFLILLNNFICGLDPVSFVSGIFVIFFIEICFHTIEFLKFLIEEDKKKN